jgi:hypothetical protein
MTDRNMSKAQYDAHEAKRWHEQRERDQLHRRLREAELWLESNFSSLTHYHRYVRTVEALMVQLRMEELQLPPLGVSSFLRELCDEDPVLWADVLDASRRSADLESMPVQYDEGDGHPYVTGWRVPGMRRRRWVQLQQWWWHGRLRYALRVWQYARQQLYRWQMVPDAQAQTAAWHGESAYWWQVAAERRDALLVRMLPLPDDCVAAVRALEDAWRDDLDA